MKRLVVLLSLLIAPLGAIAQNECLGISSTSLYPALFSSLDASGVRHDIACLDPTNNAMVIPKLFAPNNLPSFTPTQFPGVTCKDNDEGPALASMMATFKSLGGANLWLTQGNYCYSGATQIQFPPQLALFGTGAAGGGNGFPVVKPSSYWRVGTSGKLGSLEMITSLSSPSSGSQGSVTVRDMTFVNTTSCDPFFFITKEAGHFYNVSLIGSQGGNEPSTYSCNDGFILGKNQAPCNSDEDCYYVATGAHFEDIHFFNIRQGVVLNSTAQTTYWRVWMDSSDGNNSANVNGTFGPFIAALGLTGGAGTQAAIQNTIEVLQGELGNAGSNSQPTDCHYDSIFYLDNAFQNTFNAMGDDACSPTPPTAIYRLSNVAQNNNLHCYYRQSSTACYSTAGNWFNNSFTDDATNTRSTGTNLQSHLGNHSEPTNDLSLALFSVANLGNIIPGGGAPYAGMLRIVNDSADGTCTTGSGALTILCYYDGSAWRSASYNTSPSEITLSISKGVTAAGIAATLTGTGACASRSSESAGSWSGQVTCTGTTGASTLTITPGSSAPHGWNCSASDVTHTLIGSQSAVSATAPVMTFSSVTSGDVVVFGCNEY